MPKENMDEIIYHCADCGLPVKYGETCSYLMDDMPVPVCYPCYYDLMDYTQHVFRGAAKEKLPTSLGQWSAFAKGDDTPEETIKCTYIIFLHGDPNPLDDKRPKKRNFSLENIKRFVNGKTDEEIQKTAEEYGDWIVDFSKLLDPEKLAKIPEYEEERRKMMGEARGDDAEKNR